MWCLARLLPLMIGVHIAYDNQHWENFLQCMTIVDYVFAPVTSTNVLDYLTDLLEEHLILFKELYPNCPIIPKMHYLIHIPDWIKRYIAIAILTWKSGFNIGFSVGRGMGGAQSALEKFLLTTPTFN